jgi:hypothetical protein
MAATPPPALARTYAAGRPGRRRTLADRIGVLFVGAILAVGAAMAGEGLYDHIHREIVRPGVIRSWSHARQVLAGRLKQQDALEFGAVWATHSGRICGLVNGRHSFSGLAGMTPFAVEGDQAVFALDQTALAFAPYWRSCMTDQWIVFVPGSMQAGGCATKLGQARCVTVEG